METLKGPKKHLNYASDIPNSTYKKRVFIIRVCRQKLKWCLSKLSLWFRKYLSKTTTGEEDNIQFVKRSKAGAWDNSRKQLARPCTGINSMCTGRTLSLTHTGRTERELRSGLNNTPRPCPLPRSVSRNRTAGRGGASRFYQLCLSSNRVFVNLLRYQCIIRNFFSWNICNVGRFTNK